MGDRCNIVVKDGNRQVWLYGHWAGQTYVEDARRAIAKKWRWDDASYLARIVFDEFTKGGCGKETGFGITTGISDNGHAILVLDVERQEVYFIEEIHLGDGRAPESPPAVEKWSFEEFAAGEGEEPGD